MKSPFQQPPSFANSAKFLKIASCQKTGETMPAVWDWVLETARTIMADEPVLRPMLDDVIFHRHDFAEAIAARLSRKLARVDMLRADLQSMILSALRDQPILCEQMAKDLLAITDRDPACNSPLEALLFFKGFHAISTYRIGHYFWQKERKPLALYLQSLSSEVFSVDIHPAARIGCKILLDHATGFVVGETSIIEDNVSILHEVTLGGTGKETGDRHPIVRSGVLIGAGTKILGRVEIGEGAKIGAGSVVLHDVPAHTTVIGVPAIPKGLTHEPTPALLMDQSIADETSET